MRRLRAKAVEASNTKLHSKWPLHSLAKPSTTKSCRYPRKVYSYDSFKFFLQILTESRCCAKATLKLAAPRDSVVLVFKVNRLMKRPSRPTANGRPSKNGKKKTTTHLDVKPKTMRATLGGVGAPSATAATRTECSTTIFFGAQTRTVEQNTRSTTTKKLPTSAVSVNCTLQLAIAEQWRTFLVS